MSDDLFRGNSSSNSTQLPLQDQPEATEPTSTLSVDNRTQNQSGEPAGANEAQPDADATRDDPGTESGARSPPIPSSPSPDAETKLSRKREREASLEPVSSSGAGQKSAVTGYSSPSITSGHTQTPTKKNRIHRSLDATAEEDIELHHRSRSRSKSNSSSDNNVAATKDLGISASPPQEMKIKVRQISQGVEDLTWRNLKKQRIGEDEFKDDADVEVVAEDSVDQDNDKNMDFGAQSVPSAPIPISATKPAPKRPRDDADKDDNPRETKRPTPPPPDSNNTPDEVSKSVSTSKSSSSSGSGGGFMAYASTSSPFASAVKGQSSSSTKKPSIPVSSATKTSETSSSSTAGTATGNKRPGSGFEAFASSSSPFASTTGAATRAKSPKPSSGLSGSKFEAFASSSSPFGSSGSNKLGSGSGLGSSKSGSGLGFGSGGVGSGLGSSGSTKFGFGTSTSTSNAFTAYASGSGSVFGASSSSSSPSPFGAGARSQGKNGFAGFGGDGDDGDNDGGEDDEDDEDSSSSQRVALSEQEVSTGEELEETIHQVRGKLFALVDGAWKERGTGQLKINVRAEDGGGARLVMRKEAVYTLLLNVTLFAGMKCSLAQDPRYVRFSVIEGAGASTGAGGGEGVVLGNGNGAATVTTHYNLRLANAKIASELMEAIHENLPPK